MSETPEWYYTNNRQPIGPVSVEQLRQLVSRGSVQANDLVWKEGMADWVPASSVANLFSQDPLPGRDRWPTDSDERDRPRPVRGRYDDDDEDFARPRRKRRVEYDDDDIRLPRRSKPKSHLALILALSIGGLFLLLGAGFFVLVIWLANDRPAHGRPRRAIAAVKGAKKAGALEAIAPGRGPWLGELTDFDADDPPRPFHYCRVYTYPMTAGTTYTIDLESDDFDAYLRLEDANQNQLAFNDDAFPGTQDSQIIFTAPGNGRYRIIVTTFAQTEIGAYRLKISP